MKVVVFLQNAWSETYAGRTWPRESWLAALWRSRTGQRLKTFAAALSPETAAQVHYDNTTEIVGANPHAIVPADPVHIQRVLDAQQPDVVVALGKEAWTALKRLWPGTLVVGPHPAYRVATNEVFKAVAEHVESGGSVLLEQKRGRVQVSELPTRRIAKQKER